MAHHITSRLVLTVVFSGFVGVHSAASGQSFDCVKAASQVEKIICADAELKAADTRMAELYARALKATPAADQAGLRSEQRGWIKTRDQCSTATEPKRNCVSYAYEQRNGRLQGLISSSGTGTTAPAAATGAAPQTSAASTAGRLTLAPGQPPTVQKGTVAGRGDVTYTVPGRKGQTLVVDLQTASTSLYFNVLPAGSEEGIYMSDRGETGNKAAIVLPADGDYRIMVYLFRNEARRGTKAAFTISLSLK